MITIMRESYAQLNRDIRPLLEKHWREVALYQDEVKLEPDFEGYERLDAQGSLVMLAARKDGVLVGYSIFLLHQHIHYKSCRMASNDVLFLDADERKSLTGLRLIRESEAELKRLGVDRVTWHIKPKNDFSAILTRMGYEAEETVYGRLLGESHGR